MIPEFSIEVKQDCNPNNLHLPEEGLMKYDAGLIDNHHYIDMRGLSWEDAKEALKLEWSIVEKADAKSSTKEEFEDTVNELVDKDADNRLTLYELDIGVAAATIAFSAAGCAPVSSCRGHQMNDEAHPYVGGWVDRKRAEILIQICKECGVSTSNYSWEQNEGIIIYSSNIKTMMKFAESLIESAERFKQEDNRRDETQHKLTPYLYPSSRGKNLFCIPSVPTLKREIRVLCNHKINGCC